MSTPAILPIEFTYEDHTPVRVQFDELENPWFNAQDVCNILEISNPYQAVARLDPDEKMHYGGLRDLSHPSGQKVDHDYTVDNSMPHLSGSPARVDAKAWYISEPGLYALIQTSRKPEARRFSRWLTHEVLPQLRRTGSYQISAPQPSVPLVQTIEAILELAKSQEIQEQRNQARYHAAITQTNAVKIEAQRTVQYAKRELSQELSHLSDRVQDLEGLVQQKAKPISAPATPSRANRLPRCMFRTKNGLYRIRFQAASLDLSFGCYKDLREALWVRNLLIDHLNLSLTKEKVADPGPRKVSTLRAKINSKLISYNYPTL